MQLKLVINNGYGGFTITKEIAEYLKTHKNWKIAKIEGYTLPTETPPNTIYHIHYSGKPSQDYWCHKPDSIEFRSNPDLIEAITKTKQHLEQQYQHNQIEWKDYYYNQLRKYKIINITTLLEIESYNDGHERVIIHQTEQEDHEDNPENTTT